MSVRPVGASTRAHTPKSGSAKGGKKSPSGPKSFKADGTPKKRWSTDERNERGHGPRRRGGQAAAPAARSNFRLERNDSSFRRPELTESSDRRPERTEPTYRRPERTESTYRRPERTESAVRRPERTESTYRRPERTESFDRRPERTESTYRRPERTDSADRRPERTESTYRRPERTESTYRRDDRPAPANRRYDRPDTKGHSQHDRPHHDRSHHDGAGAHESGSDTMSWTPREISADHLTPVSGENGFARLGVPKSLVSALQAEGITDPFPIQAATIPDALAGRDVLGRGQTGSGKTLGFGLPMLSTLAGSAGKAPRGIVLVPTRELAMQVADVLAPLAKTVNLSVTLIAGGMSYTPQFRAFERGVDIVVATPGRLIDLMEQGAVDLSRVEVAVLDEADHMADLGFMPAVTTILDAIPAGGQRMLFSATLDRAIDRLVKKYLTDPVTHEVDSGQATVSTMAHHLVHILPHDKNQLTAEIAARAGRTLVFVRTQRGADRVAEQLRDGGVLAGALHGGLTQGARTRILAAFKDGHLPVLVATDVAARGIHVDDIGLVLQVDPPVGPKDYLHRAGRTARAGGTGVVVTLALPHQRRDLTRLTSQAGVTSVPLEARPGDQALATVTGARKPSGVAIGSGDYERLIAPPSRGGGRPRGGKDFSRRDSGSRGFGGRGRSSSGRGRG